MSVVEQSELWLEDQRGLAGSVATLECPAAESVHIAKLAHPAPHLRYRGQGEAATSEAAVQRLGGVSATLLALRTARTLLGQEGDRERLQQLAADASEASAVRSAAVLLINVDQQHVDRAVLDWCQQFDTERRKALACGLLELADRLLTDRARDDLLASAAAWDWS